VDIDKITELCADCGNCLHYCPVYNAELTEPNSPRGKVNLVKALYDGTFHPSDQLEIFTYQCVLCGSCEYNCTKGVEFTDMMIEFRNRRSKGKNIPILRKIILSIYDLNILKILVKFLFLIPKAIQKKIKVLPVSRFSALNLKKKIKRNRDEKFDILLFPGCMINLFYTDIKERIYDLLTIHGFSVVIPDHLKCCGAPYKTQGWNEKFLKLKKKNKRIFSKYKFKYIVIPCGTGVKTFRKYYDIKDAEVFELTEFIYKFIKDAKINRNIINEGEKITYHDPCHNLKLLNIKDEPRFFMKKFDKNFVDDNSELCCGFGGLFSVNFGKTSKKILKRREDRIEEIGADTVVTSCPGCYYQLQKNNKQNVKFFIDIFEW